MFHFYAILVIKELRVQILQFNDLEFAINKFCDNRELYGYIQKSIFVYPPTRTELGTFHTKDQRSTTGPIWLAVHTGNWVITKHFIFKYVQ